MILFKHEHAARNWAYHQRKWFRKRTEVVRLKNETPEGARWAVKELED